MIAQELVFRVGLGAFFVGCGATALGAAGPPSSPAKGQLSVYIGTYTNRASKGIYLCRLDLDSGKLHLVGLAAEVARPSFLALHPSRPLLYAVGEMDSFAAEKAGAVSAMAIDAASGKLTLLNQQSSRGAGPCHVAVDAGGRYVLVANYAGGSIACLPIQEDGRLGETVSFVQHKGSSVNRQRQEGPHAHCVNFDTANRFLFAADLGLDKIMIYRLGATDGKLVPNGPASASTPPGAGPRHLAFHPNGRWAYSINELDSTVSAFTYDPEHGALRLGEGLSTLPADFGGENWPAEIAIHPNGKFLYGSNRGHNSIAIFAIDAATGKLRPVGHEPTQGKTPRNFAIDPTGTFLLAANQQSDNVVVFRIDAASGKLQPAGGAAEVPTPVCVCFVPPAR